MTVLSVRVQFGDSQQLRLVRILRSTVMVRVGGGWMALDEFLVKNDPCRGNIHPVYVVLNFSPCSGGWFNCIDIINNLKRQQLFVKCFAPTVLFQNLVEFPMCVCSILTHHRRIPNVKAVSLSLLPRYLVLTKFKSRITCPSWKRQSNIALR